MRRHAPWLALLAPTFPVLVLSVAMRVVAGVHDPHVEWALVPFSALYGLWNMATSALAALGCASLALRWGAVAPTRRSVFALATCGVLALVPWSLVVSTDCLRATLGNAWSAHGPLAWWRDWVAALTAADPTFGWPLEPTHRAFWILVAPGLAMTALALWRAVPFVPARVRRRFFLIWCPVLALLVSVVCGIF
jgi:hypothetical protein